jgi:hypothetical protein
MKPQTLAVRVRKLYPVLDDPEAEANGLICMVDDSVTLQS